MKRNLNLLVSETITPQDIGLLILILIYSQDFGVGPGQCAAKTIIDLLEGIPFLDNNELIIAPNALHLCDRLQKDCQTSSETNSQSIKILLNRFLRLLWLIDSPETLDGSIINSIMYVDTSKSIISEPEDDSHLKFSSRSIIGSFIEKVVATVHYLHFDELFLVYESFVSYREPTRDLYISFGNSVITTINCESPIKFGKTDSEDNDFYHQLNNAIGKIPYISLKMHQVQDTEIFQEPTEILPISKESIESLLAKQVEMLQIRGSVTSQKLRDIMELITNPDSKIHYLQTTTTNNIQNYYYLKFLECLLALDYHGSFKALHQYFDYMVSNNSKYFYHYALLSKANLHQYFGEEEKALDSIEEAVSVARENSDNITLTHILNWLYNFMRNRPHLWKYQNFYHNNNELHLLDFLVKKSKLVSFQLYTLSYQLECLHIIDNGGFMSAHMESLFKAVYVSINDNIPSFIKSMELASNIWTRIGNPHLSTMYCSIADDFAKVIKNSSEQVSINTRTAYLMYLQGNIDEAYSLLEGLLPKVQTKESVRISVQRRRLLMLAYIHIHRGRYKLAEAIMIKLIKDDITEIELKSEIIYLKAKILLCLDSYSQSMEVITSYLAQPTHSQTKTNLYTIMKLNLLKCEIFNRTNNSTRAIALLVQQLQQAKRIGFVSIITEGIIILGSILNDMKSFVDCYKVLTLKMISILSVGNQELISLAYYELSRACVNIVKLKQYKTIAKTFKDLFTLTLRYLQFSITIFHRIGNTVMLEKCFQLELHLGVSSEKLELIAHSENSIENSQIQFAIQRKGDFIE